MESDNKTFNNNLPTKSAKKPILPIVLIVLIVLLLGGGAFGFYKLNEDRQVARNDVAKLEAEIKQLKQKLTENDNKVSEADKLAETKKALESAFVARDNAKMVELMADSVIVILAASEGMPAQSPADATSYLLSYMKDAGTWNFALPEAEVTKYKQGDYKPYLADSFSIGKASHGQVVSFSLNEQQKVSQIFMCVSADLL